MIVHLDYPSTADDAGWHHRLVLPRVPMAGEMLTGPPPHRCLYKVSAVQWRPWGLWDAVQHPRGRDPEKWETEPHILVLLRKVSDDADKVAVGQIPA